MRSEKSVWRPVVSPGQEGERIPGFPRTGHRIQYFLLSIKGPAVFMNRNDEVSKFLITLGHGPERVFQRKCRRDGCRIEL